MITMRELSPVCACRRLAQLQSASLHAAALSQRQHLGNTCRRLLPLLAASERSPASDAERLEVLAWAESIVRSRALTIADQATSSPERMLLLPAFDLCNHRSRGPAEREASGPTVVVAGDGTVVFAAGAPLAAGEGVALEYQARGNAALLLDYGFAEPLTPLAPGTERLALLHTRDGAAPARLTLSAARLDGLLAAARAAARRSCDAASAEANEPASLALHACNAILASCRAKLRAMPTSLEEDDASLASLGRPAGGASEALLRRRHALHFRMGRKQLLRAVMARIEEALRDSPRLSEIVEPLAERRASSERPEAGGGEVRPPAARTEEPHVVEITVPKVCFDALHVHVRSKEEGWRYFFDSNDRRF